jgi:hypothetical protein
MKNSTKIMLLLTLISTLPLSIFGRGSFGGSFLGGFSGSLIGNAISQPRQPRGTCVYQQPVQTRVVEVHRPTYVEVQTYPTKEEMRHKENRKRIIEEHEEKQLETRLKELEVKKAEAELARAQAENERLKLENEQLKKNLNKSSPLYR